MSTDRLALRRTLDGAECSIKRTLDIVGDPWTLLILRECFWGVRRFSDFQTFLGIPRTVLTNRLAKMTAHRLLARSVYQEKKSRPRYEYVLTAAGRNLLPALIALMQWGDDQLGVGPARVVSKATGEPVGVQMITQSGKIIGLDQVRAVPGKKA